MNPVGRIIFRGFPKGIQRLIAGAIHMQKNSLNKRFKLALAGSLFFGVGGAWGQGPVSSYALPQPRNPIAGNPAPIASSKNPSLNVPTIPKA
jgi:hypothetical protein